MRLKEEHRGGEVPYLLDCGNGTFSQSAMPAPVADEIARRAKQVGESGRDGYELLVDGAMLFPADMFRDESEERAEPSEAPAPERKSGSGGKRCRR